MAPLNRFNNRPKVKSIPLDPYLERIQVEKEEPSMAFLKKLHKGHLLNIPYENLDIVFKKRANFDVKWFFEKIVHQKRGGISTELNILFYHLLVGLGFDCVLTSARIKKKESWGPEFDLPVIIVRLEGISCLADVGSMSLFFEPIKLITQRIQLDYNQYFRFEADPDENFILQKSNDSANFQCIYKFGLQSKEVIQFMERFNYLQEAVDSPIVQNMTVFKHTKEGKVLLTDTSIQIVQKGLTNNISILHGDDFSSKLLEHFGLDYDKLFRERFNQ